MKLKLLLFLGLFLTITSYGQYTTPNTGVNWTLDDIATESPETITISGAVYTLHQNLTIAENDSFQIDTDITLQMDEDIQVTVFGVFLIQPDTEALITATNPSAPYRGFRFEEHSEIDIQNAIFEYGGGLQVLTETFSLDSCVLRNNVSGVNSSAVVNFTRGIVTVTNNHFLNNLHPALASGANSSVSGNFTGNTIEYNNSQNSNRPQINMGPTRLDIPLVIANNIILGNRDYDMTGGIAVSNLIAAGNIYAIIEGNLIQDNRYGIAITGGNADVLIKNNIIEDNDSQGNPMAGGSGINLNSASQQIITLTGNEIRRNLWGITIQGTQNNSSINMGDDQDNPGENLFADNENEGGVYALYNNGPTTIMAKHNCWIEGVEITLEDAENVIFHQVDNSNFGEVIFDPIFCATSSTNDFEKNTFVIYPNPTKNTLFFDNTLSFKTIQIMDIQGKKVFEQTLSDANNEILFELPQGVYIAKFTNKNNTIVKKLVIK